MADPSGQGDLQVNKVGGLREDLSKNLRRERNPVFLVSVNQRCLICLQLGKKGHSMSVTRKSSAEYVHHVELTAVEEGFCKYSLHNALLPTSGNAKIRSEKRKRKNVEFIQR